MQLDSKALQTQKWWNLLREIYYMKLITHNLSDIFINTNNIYTNLIIANPVEKTDLQVIN